MCVIDKLLVNFYNSFKLCVIWSFNRGVGSGDGGRTRLRLSDEFDQVRKHLCVTLRLFVEGAKYYEEGKDTYRVKLDLTLHL